MSIWRDRECPSDSRDAFREGRRSESYDRNPYEHGRDAFADRDCREAHDEWARGHRYAEYDREREEEERQEQRRAEQRAANLREQEERPCYGDESY